MRINRLRTENNSTLGKIKELTIYHVLKNPNRDTINGQNNSFANTTENISYQNNINNPQLKIDIKKIENNFSNQSPISNSFKLSHPPEFLDDEYILELHKKIKEKREQRKISEQNVKILNGRVRCLKDENKKMCAKIDLTKKKTKEKEMAINNHRSRSKEKQELQEKKKKDLKILTLKNRQQKLITQANLINTKENLFLKNKIKGQISKAQKLDNENIKKENELNNKMINKNKTEVVRYQINNNNQKKKIAEIKKKEELIKSLEAKINMENRKKKELEDEMKKLNIMENEILGRIYANNEMQKKLIENFEKNFGQSFVNNTNDVLMSINNINNSYVNEINGLDQFYEDYE